MTTKLSPKAKGAIATCATTEKEFLDLVDKLKYQVLTPSVTTWGACPDCGEGSRGSDRCSICIINQAPDDVKWDLESIYRRLEDWQRAWADVEKLVDKTTQRLRRKG